MTIATSPPPGRPAGPGLRLVRHYPAGAADVVELAGDLDLCAAGPLRALLRDLITGAGRWHIVVDLRGVTFLDAAGLGALIGGWKHTRDHGGSFTVACTDKRLLHILRLTGLAAVLGVCASVDQALGGVPAAPSAAGASPAPRPLPPRHPGMASAASTI